MSGEVFSVEGKSCGASESRQGYRAPKLVKLPLNATESGIVTLPIEILGVQGPS